MKIEPRPDLIDKDPATLTPEERHARMLAYARIVLERCGLDPDRPETWPPFDKMARRIEDIPVDQRPRVH